MPVPRALAFDVYGTVVDWRGSVIREGSSIDPSRDWPNIADAWRRLYRPTIDRVTRGDLPWAPFDELQRMMLDEVLPDLPDMARDDLAGVWSRMDAWPDAVPGLARLKRNFIITPLSNGSMRQLVGIARHAQLPWDLVLSVELFHAYKPDPRIYRGAVELLQLQPAEVMMVATHTYDLRAARSEGLQTAFVARPYEWGPAASAEDFSPDEFTLVARDFEDLATQLNS